MDPFLLRVFASHIDFHIQSTDFARQVARQGHEQRNPQIIWVGLHWFLTDTANVSKALWGPGNNATVIAARAPLREALQVADDSPLRTSDLRNHIEHLDERIDRWWAKSKNHLKLDFYVGPPGMIEGVDPIDRFRAFDEDAGIAYFWEESFDLNAIITELERIHPLAKHLTDPRSMQKTPPDHHRSESPGA